MTFGKLVKIQGNLIPTKENRNPAFLHQWRKRSKTGVITKVITRGKYAEKGYEDMQKMDMNTCRKKMLGIYENRKYEVDTCKQTNE